MQGVDAVPEDERPIYLYFASDTGHQSATTSLCLLLTQNKANNARGCIYWTRTITARKAEYIKGAESVIKRLAKSLSYKWVSNTSV